MNRKCTQARDVGVIEVTFVRNFVNFLICIPLVLYYGEGVFDGYRPDTRKIMIIRNLVGSQAYLTQSLAFKLLPLGIANVIVMSAPFVVAGLAKVMFNDTVTTGEMGSVGLSFIGLLVMAYAKPIDVELKQST